MAWRRLGRDRGTKLGPVISLNAPGDIGLIIRAGVSQSRYSFRVRPHAARTMLTVEYATGVSAWRVTGSVDRRREGSDLHFVARARMSEFELINFHGFGNATPDSSTDFFRAEQRQWLFQPALALALGTRSDFTFGPVFQYATTDSAADRFISSSRPYGSGSFGQAGLRLGLYHDLRDRPSAPRNGILLDLSATWYPALWDVSSAFASLGGAGTAYYTIPLPLHPILVLRASAQKLFGEFPFHESAFLGGRGSVRVLEPQRYAGDLALGGTTELQLPLGRVPLFLPIDAGIYGFADAGRVWFEGESPGGWHTGAGVGFWVGLLGPATALSVEVGAHGGQSLVRVRTGVNF